jgi:hypothetical protein
VSRKTVGVAVDADVRAGAPIAALTPRAARTVAARRSRMRILPTFSAVGGRP